MLRVFAMAFPGGVGLKVVPPSNPIPLSESLVYPELQVTSASGSVGEMYTSPSNICGRLGGDDRIGLVNVIRWVRVER